MTRTGTPPRRTLRVLLAGGALALALTSCGAPTAEEAAAPGPGGGAAAETGPHASHAPSGGPAGAASGQVPSSHVHGVGVNPADGLVYVATHDGLFRFDATGPVRVGGVNDLMGFTVAGPDHFYASGHPGPGSDLPNPLGLVESTDAGATWQPLSRQRESDFHTLTASDAGVLGFDGTLRASPDGETWTELPMPAAPFSLAVSPDGSTVLGTTEDGPLRSQDAGRTWERVAAAPLLMLVDWADGATVVGLTPDGRTAVSADAGLTWELRGEVGGRPQALSASGEGDDLSVVAVGDAMVLTSADGGRTY